MMPDFDAKCVGAGDGARVQLAHKAYSNLVPSSQ